jgi:hypothetical protein
MEFHHFDGSSASDAAQLDYILLRNRPGDERSDLHKPRARRGRGGKNRRSEGEWHYRARSKAETAPRMGSRAAAEAARILLSRPAPHTPGVPQIGAVHTVMISGSRSIARDVVKANAGGWQWS